MYWVHIFPQISQCEDHYKRSLLRIQNCFCELFVNIKYPLGGVYIVIQGEVYLSLGPLER